MHFNLKLCLGVLVCWGVAAFLTFFLDDSGELRLAAPVICLLVLIPTATYCGRVAGLIGSVGASMLLAMRLYSPYGSLAIDDPAARVMMTVCQVSAVVVVMIAPRYPITIWKWRRRHLGRD